MWSPRGIEPREGAELSKRDSVCQRSSQGAKAPQRSARAQRGRDSLPRHLELTGTSAKGSFSFMWSPRGIEPREGAELSKRDSVCQRSSQGAKAPQRSARAQRGRDSLPRHLELTRTSAKGSFSFIYASVENASRNFDSERDTLSASGAFGKVRPGIWLQSGTRFPLRACLGKLDPESGEIAGCTFRLGLPAENASHC